MGNLAVLGIMKFILRHTYLVCEENHFVTFCNKFPQFSWSFRQHYPVI